MPVSIELLRGVLAVLSLFFAWQAGRIFVALKRGEVRQPRFIAWMVRMLVCALGLLFPQRAVDTVTAVVWLLDALLFLAGIRTASHRKPPEDLTDTIFPDKP